MYYKEGCFRHLYTHKYTHTHSHWLSYTHSHTHLKTKKKKRNMHFHFHGQLRRVSHSGGGMGGHPSPSPPQSYNFFQKKKPIKTDALMGCPPTPLYLKMKPPHLRNKLPLKSEAPFQEMIPRKNLQKIGNCH